MRRALQARPFFHVIEIPCRLRLKEQARPILPGPSLGAFHVGVEIESEPKDALDWIVIEGVV